MRRLPEGLRFDVTERALHWTNAVLVLVLLGTGACLYFGPLSTLVGRRELLKTVHVWSGLALPVPFLVAYGGPWSRMLRADTRILGRWGADKFNNGQKLNAAFVAGALVLLFVTGLMLRWPDPFRDDWRTGATFVHDWAFVGLALSTAGHVWLALSDRHAMRAMLRGSPYEDEPAGTSTSTSRTRC